MEAGGDINTKRRLLVYWSSPGGRTEAASNITTRIMTLAQTMARDVEVATCLKLSFQVPPKGHLFLFNNLIKNK
jgi:hypothetical protein